MRFCSNQLLRRDAMHFETKAVHVGVNKDPRYGSVTTPIYPTSTFEWNNVEDSGEYEYTRAGNPTRAAMEESIAAMEGGAGCRGVSSGMAAITCATAQFSPGDHIIAPNDLYGGSFRLFTDFLSKKGLSFSYVPMTDPDQIRAAVTPQTKCIWIETPSNPLLRVFDIAAIVGIARSANLTTIADNTFLSPYYQRPLALGVDIVVHSTTKYLNGHSDVIGGCVVSRTATTAKHMAWTANCLGVACSPFDAWLVLRGLKTLPVRMQAHSRNAMRIAEFLAAHEAVERVHYPGLPDHAQHELAKEQQDGFGGMLSFEARGGRAVAERVCMKTKLFTLAESLGGIESLIEYPTTMTHASMTAEARAAAGIQEGLVRVSAGIENPDDLIADLAQALEE